MFVSALLEYEGTNFFGSQYQRNIRTVQGELEKALKKTFKYWHRVKFASRTDSGVHSIGQVVAINMNETGISLKDFQVAVNNNLPSDISLRESQEVAESFDPRRDAIAREYLYRISLKEYISPFESRFVANMGQGIDFFLLKQSAKFFKGVHDFKSLTGRSFRDNGNSVRRVFNVTCIKKKTLIEIRVLGNSFVHQQVRRMVALMVKVGQGQYPMNKIKEIIKAEQKGILSFLAPAKGLFLNRILYSDNLFSNVHQSHCFTGVKYVNSLK